MRMIRSFLLSLFVLPFHADAQQWIELMQDPAVNVHDVQAAFDAHWNGRPYERSKGYKMFRRWEWWMEQRTYPTGVRPDAGVFNTAVKDAKAMARCGLTLWRW